MGENLRWGRTPYLGEPGGREIQYDKRTISKGLLERYDQYELTRSGSSELARMEGIELSPMGDKVRFDTALLRRRGRGKLRGWRLKI